MSIPGSKVRAVLLALLVVGATIGPASAAHSSGTTASAVSSSGSPPRSQARENVSGRLASSALEHRVLAARALASSNHSDADRLAELTNGTFDAFYDRNRTRRSTFRTDKKVAAAGQNVSMDVTHHIVESDAILARTALQDA